MLDFTKGPWEAEEIYDSFWAVFANDLPVAECNNNEANARLIAAAPEMYEALKVCLDFIEDIICRNCEDCTLKLEAEALREALEEQLARIDGKETAND